MPFGRWYLSAAAMREYLRIAGLPDDDGGPIWQAAEKDLARHCQAARKIDRLGNSGAEQWRTGKMSIGGRNGVRLEFSVMPAPRAEGALPQLLRVRAK